MQLLLSCLNFLRGQYLDAMVAFQRRGEGAREGGKRGKPPKGGAAATPSPGAAPGEAGPLTLDDIDLWSKVGRRAGGWVQRALLLQMLGAVQLACPALWCTASTAAQDSHAKAPANAV